MPSSARRINSGSMQLLAGYILNYLETRVPEDAASVMAITPIDLYPANNWNFVFGLARTKNRVGVSSFYRYRPDSLGTASYSKCLERLIKTSSHEIGHMFGCEHCIYAVCVMNGSNSMKESDSIPNRLCTVCLAKLQWNLGFEVKPRLNDLMDFFSKYKLDKDYDYARADLVSLN